MITCTGVPPIFPQGCLGARTSMAPRRVYPTQIAWGGWDSNPGPADYESGLPAAGVM